MSEDVQVYVDERFDKLRNDLKWGVGILASLLSTILIIYGLQIHKLNLKQQEQDFNIRVLEASYNDIAWKQGWLMESSELQRDYIEAIAVGKDTKGFFDEIDRMNARIMTMSTPTPTMRSGD